MWLLGLYESRGYKVPALVLVILPILGIFTYVSSKLPAISCRIVVHQASYRRNPRINEVRYGKEAPVYKNCQDTNIILQPYPYKFCKISTLQYPVHVPPTYVSNKACPAHRKSPAGSPAGLRTANCNLLGDRGDQVRSSRPLALGNVWSVRH